MHPVIPTALKELGRNRKLSGVRNQLTHDKTKRWDSWIQAQINKRASCRDAWNYQWKSKKRYIWHWFHPGISKTPTISNTKLGLLLAYGHHQWVWPCSQTREQPQPHRDQAAAVQSDNDAGTARRAGNASNQAGGNRLEYQLAAHARNNWAAEGFKLGPVWAETPHAILGSSQEN